MIDDTTLLMDQPRVQTRSGARAEVDDSDRLQVYSKRGELVFTYDPATETSRLTVPRGNLELATREGDINLAAAGDVRIGGRSVSLAGRSAVRAAVVDAAGRLLSTFALRGDRARLEGRSVGVRAARARVEVADAKVSGERLRTAFETVVAKARNVYQQVRELAQLRTGRRRVLADDSYILKAKTARLRSEEEFKVDGETVHLG